MRGVRFEFSHNVGTERIYLDERELTKLRSEVDLMELVNTAALGEGERTARGNSVPAPRPAGCRIPCSGYCARNCSGA